MPHLTFIHGIANKPPEDALLKIWLNALADDSLGNGDGINPGTYGITSSMIYWADVLYENPLAEGKFESSASLESAEKTIALQEAETDIEWINHLDGKEAAIMKKLAAKFIVSEKAATAAATIQSPVKAGLERIPLPWPVKKLLMKVLLKDVHHYLFNVEFEPRPGTKFMVQDEIRKRVIKKLNAVKTDVHIVVSHSMGTLIMYDCLKRLNACPGIDSFMTIGSPLGIDEVQDCLKPEWTRKDGYAGKIKNNWVNVYDVLDPVTGFDGNIANDFMKNGKKIIQVIREENEGAWRHDITKYLKRPKLRKALRGMLGI